MQLICTWSNMKEHENKYINKKKSQNVAGNYKSVFYENVLIKNFKCSSCKNHPAFEGFPSS